MQESDAIIPDGFQATYDKWHYSAAARAGDLLFVSGVIGLNSEGKPPADAEEQFIAAFEDIKLTLHTAGGSLADIVEITSYHIDWVTNRDAFVAVKDRFLCAPWPAWTAIGVAELGIPAALAEIRVTANLAR